jgi:hypothetical protein
MSKRCKDMFYMKRLSMCACPSLKNRLKKLCGEKSLQGFVFISWELTVTLKISRNWSNFEKEKIMSYFVNSCRIKKY